jgi:hypothetical protein
VVKQNVEKFTSYFFFYVRLAQKFEKVQELFRNRFGFGFKNEKIQGIG